MNEQIYWVVKLTKPDGEVGFMNFNHDVTTSFKYVATFQNEQQAKADVARHMANVSHKNTQFKYWINDGAEVRFARLSMSLIDEEAEIERALKECIEKGFRSIPIEERIKILEEQKKRVEESERCFKTDRKQLERQFTL